MRAYVLAFIITLFVTTSVHGQLSDFNETDFKKADSIAELYPRHPLQDLKVLSDKLTRPLSTDVEKFRAIFKWVCLNVESDYALFVENKNMRRKLRGEKLTAWEKKFSVRVFNIMTAQHRTICTGYAYLVKELAFHAELNCRIVDGYSRHARTNIGGSGVVNHSWNAVELQGKWYLCDPTWSSGTIEGERQTFVKKFENAYFLSEPRLFARNHYPLDSQWIRTKVKPSLQAFLDAPLVYSTSFRYGVEPLAPTSFSIDVSRGGVVFFQFTKDSGMEFSNVALYVENFKTNDAFTKQEKGCGTSYSVEHKFFQKGKYAVHIVVDGSHVLSYDVRVN